MVPNFCQTAHRPPDTHGDCVRACIASIMDVDDPATVPHFFRDGCDAHTGMARIVEYLQPLGYLPFYVAYPGTDSLQDVLDTTSGNNPGVHYMLFGGTDTGADHVVICCDGRVVHNPGVGADVTRPTVAGMWIIMVVVRP